MPSRIVIPVSAAGEPDENGPSEGGSPGPPFTKKLCRERPGTILKRGALPLVPPVGGEPAGRTSNEPPYRRRGKQPLRLPIARASHTNKGVVSRACRFMVPPNPGRTKPARGGLNCKASIRVCLRHRDAECARAGFCREVWLSTIRPNWRPSTPPRFSEDNKKKPQRPGGPAAWGAGAGA